MTDPLTDPTDHRQVRTERLWLDEPVPADAAALHAVHADPAVWRHFPSGRHTDPRTASAMVVESVRLFATTGLGGWVVRDVEGGPVLGWVGVRAVPDRPWWNLHYRLARAVHGRGYAVEAASAAVTAAHAVDPDRPVLAFLLEHNVASRRTAERVGLHPVRRCRDVGNPDPDAVRLVLADRDLAPSVGKALDSHLAAPGR